MPIKLPDHLPAKEILSNEGIFVMGASAVILCGEAENGCANNKTNKYDRCV